MLCHCQIFVLGDMCLWYMCVYVHMYVQVLTHMHVCTEVRERRMPGTLVLFESGFLTEPGAWALFPVPPFPHSTGVTVMYMPMQIFFTWVQQAL